MIQHQQPSPSFLSLLLLKFSFADDDVSETVRFSWKHTVHDLAIVFDTFRSSEAHVGQPLLTMKIVQGTQVLELLNIEERIRTALNVVETMRQVNVDIRVDQLPISGLSRCPLLAIRYSLPDRKIRRLQLKFSSDADFKTVNDLLTRLGLRIQEYAAPSMAPSSAKSTPSSKLQDCTGPSCPPSSLVAISDWSANPVSTHFVTGSNNINTQMERAYKPKTDTSLNTEVQRSQLATKAAPTQSLPPTSYGLSMQSAYRARDSDHMSSPRSSTIPPVSSSTPHDVTRPLSAFSTFNAHDCFAVSSPVSQSHHQQPGSYQNVDQRPFTSSPGPSDRQSEMAAAVRNHFPRLQMVTEESGPSAAVLNSRPPTALLLPPDDLLSRPIPPRGELPLHRSLSPKSSSRPSTAELPPLPKPTFLSDTNIDSPNHARAGRMNSHTPTDNGGAHPASRPLSAISSNVQNANIPQTQEPNTRPPDFSGLDGFAAQFSVEAASINAEDLAQYSSQSADERQDVLNNFMIEHISDDNFLILCQDVYGCWRRIALGLE